MRAQGKYTKTKAKFHASPQKSSPNWHENYLNFEKTDSAHFDNLFIEEAQKQHLNIKYISLERGIEFLSRVGKVGPSKNTQVLARTRKP